MWPNTAKLCVEHWRFNHITRMELCSQTELETKCTSDSLRHTTANRQVTKECETLNPDLKFSANSTLAVCAVFLLTV